MKTKLLFFSLLLAAIGGSLFAQEGTPVKALYGSGAPQASLIGPGVVGTQYIDQSTTPPTVYTCTIVTIANPNKTCTWTAGGSSSSSSPAPRMGGYLSSDCSVVTNPYCFNTPANTQQDVTASWSSSSPTITITDGKFTSADVGKRAFGYGTCNDFTGNTLLAGPFTMGSNALSGAIAIFGDPTVTIATFVDSNHVTLSRNPDNAVALTPNVGGCFIWGTPDDAAAAAMHTAFLSSLTCPKAFLASSGYMFTFPPAFMFTQYTPCAQLGLTYGGAFANVFYTGGYEVEGRGRGNTVIWITPGFPESGPGCVNGPESNACLVRTLEGRWSDLTITGGQNAFGNSASVNNSQIFLRVVGPGEIDRVALTNWGAGASNVRGMRVSGWENDSFLDNSGLGSICMDVFTGANNLYTGYRVRCENSPNVALQVEGTGPVAGSYAVQCHSCGLYAAQFVGNGALAVIYNQGGGAILLDQGTDVQSGNSSSSASGLLGYSGNTVTGSKLVVKDSDFHFSLGAGTTNSAIKCTAACDVYLENADITAQSGGKTYQDVAGSRLFDLNSNTGFTSGGGASIVGQLIAEGHSLKGTCTGVGTAASTLGLYGTGPNVTATTCTSATIGSGSPMQGARTVLGLVVTATAAGTNASSGVVTVLKNGVATTITCTIGTGTACTDGTHSAAFADGDLISIQFTTQAADTLAGIKAIADWQ